MHRDLEEKQLIVDCARQGAEALNSFADENLDHDFVPAPAYEGLKHFPKSWQDFLAPPNQNAFYARLALLLERKPSVDPASVLRGNTANERTESILHYLENQVYIESDFERTLTERVTKNSALDEQSLKENFSNAVEVEELDITKLPTTGSLYFTKVNHGYWEYMRVAYALQHTNSQETNFRDVAADLRIRRLKNSGLTQMWGQLLSKYFAGDGSASQIFSISLTNGTELIRDSLAGRFTAVNQGACCGFLSMLQASQNVRTRVKVSDGTATRNLVFRNQLFQFAERFIVPSQACVFVVPPHLAGIECKVFEGEQYTFVVPPQRLNETWRAVAATLIGYLLAIKERHESITIVGQGASVVSMLGLLMGLLKIFEDTTIRYFDLGLVLDLAAPAKLDNLSWLGKDRENAANAARQTFSLTEEPTPHFISLFQH